MVGVICPTGQITSFRQIRFVQPFLKKYFAFSESQIRCMSYPVPQPPEGRIAIVTDVGCGMRWTRLLRRTNAASADGKAVWSWHPDAGVKSFGRRSREATEANKPGTPRRARNKPLKPLRRECRRCFGDLWRRLVCFLPPHTRLRVCQTPRHSLHPLLRRVTMLQNSGIPCRDIVGACAHQH